VSVTRLFGAAPKPQKAGIMDRALEVGSQVVYVDAKGIAHRALVTHVWRQMADASPDNQPGCNLVYVSGDAAKEDPYGRQLERATSVVYKSRQPAHGFFWAWSDEVEVS